MAKKTGHTEGTAPAKTAHAKSPKPSSAPAPKRKRTESRTKKSKETVTARNVAGGAVGVNTVRIRMYCQGLGDCFLITFSRAGKGSKPFQVLIDCGVILGTPNPKDLITPVVHDILDETGGVLDVLVATHEHWDHLSGFVQAQDLFDTLKKVGEVWMGWTEDPSDATAKQLTAERNAKLEKAKKAVKAAAFHLGANDPDVEAALQTLSFFGVDIAEGMGMGAAGGAGGGGTTAAAMAWLKKKTTRYFTPGGAPFDLPGVPGVRVYVLGPPTDLKKLRKDLPTGKSKEIYELSPYDRAQLAAMENYEEDGDDPFQPFDYRFQLPLDRGANDPFLASTYFTPSEDWRRIDGEWLSGLAQFALQLDSDTNNTSLALAFELPDGRVLLFPGDAQVGNWESWHDYTWNVGGQTVKAADLLARTVLYKVGHHGSHNATLSQQGLELMTHPDLVALLPVDEYIAHEKKRWVKMPFSPLLDHLKDRTHGKILRPDKVLEAPPAQVAYAPATKTLQAEVAPGKTEARPLYVDFTLPLA